jgi:hypothetical protein
MTFVSAHRPLQTYARALDESGLVIDRIREPADPDQSFTRPLSRRWQRVPLFLHLRAVKV